MDSTPTGYSAPKSESQSLNNSGTSPSSANVAYPPTTIQRSAPAPAAPATTATMANIVERDIVMTVHSSGSSVGSSILSSAERGRRTAFVKAKRETARRELELARADEEVAASELEEARAASMPGSIARLADVGSEGGASARARPTSNAELAVPPILLDKLQERFRSTLTGKRTLACERRKRRARTD